MIRIADFMLGSASLLKAEGMGRNWFVVSAHASALLNVRATCWRGACKTVFKARQSTATPQ